MSVSWTAPNSTLPRRKGLPPGGPLQRNPEYRWPSRSLPLATIPETRENGQPKPRATGRGGIGQRKAGPAGEFSPATRLLIRTRAGGGRAEDAVCECCGRWLGEHAGEFQHRAARGAGGCRDEVINGPSNCVLLCGVAVLGTGCHGRAEARKAGMGMGIGGKGFWLRHGTTWAYDPRNVEIVRYDEARVFLAADGKGPDGSGYLRVPPGEAAA
jgi:hypothetical protein